MYYCIDLQTKLTVSEFFKKLMSCDNDYFLEIVVLPSSTKVVNKIPQILEWCCSHLHDKFEYALLGAVEDADGSYFLSDLVPESAPTGVFFAFGNPDEALMFRLAWNGDVINSHLTGF